MSQYGAVTRSPESKWVLMTASGKKDEDANVLVLLDKIGKQGWEAIAIGDMGIGSGDEILVRK